MTPPHVTALAEWFAQLTPESLARLPIFYAPDARFKDPFNEVQGRAAIRRIFDHMFEALDAPRFAIDTIVCGAATPAAYSGHAAGDPNDQAFMTWRFTFRLRGHAFQVLGATHFVFNAQGQVMLHRDYWDPAESLYQHLPVVGWITRTLQKRLRTPQPD